jgi:putative ABC transport system permease protein
MANPRWHKVLADLKVSRSRTVLVVLSIAVGVFAVGAMLTARVVLQRGVDDTLDAAHPASAVLLTEVFDDSIVEATRALPEIADAEGRASVAVRLQAESGEWLDLDLRAIADFDDIRIDRVLPQEGSWPPATGEVLIERLSIDDAGVDIGDQVVVELPDGARQTLRVGGVAYDPGQVDPTFAEDRLSGYVTLETLALLGRPAAFNELHILAAENPRDLREGEHVAALARDLVLEPNGVTVHRIAVQDSPRYHSAVLMDAAILILGLLGGLVLLLGAFLVVNTIGALLAQQVRQIGVMKAIGGRRRQIAGIYLALVLLYGLLAVALAMPIAALAAWAFADYFAQLLNLEVRGPWLPPTVVALELGIGVLVPLLAAVVPVVRGTRITVREAITSYGLSERPLRGGLLERAFALLRGVPRPVRLSLRNTFRRRGRLALTLATLTLGGAIFASVATVQTSLGQTFDEVMDYWSYDVEVTLDAPAPAAPAIQSAETVPGVERAEGWIATNASRLRPDGTQNSNIWLIAAPAGTDLIRPTLIEGRWLQPGEGEALVVNVDFRGDEGDVHVGDVVTLSVEGHQINWPVVGVASTQMMGPVVYVPYEPFSEAIGMTGEADQIVLVTEEHDSAAQAEAAQLVEQRLRSDGLPVFQVETENELRQGTQSVFQILVVLLFVVGALLVVVGGLGLAGAMSLNVLERTREVGVMRAIGASNGVVARVVVIEGLVVGLLSWLLGALLAVPLSWALSHAIGVTFVQVPLSYAFSATGVVLWLALVVVLSVLASLLPARRAWRLSVREVLAYE